MMVSIGEGKPLNFLIKQKLFGLTIPKYHRNYEFGGANEVQSWCRSL
jgi:hypothetical protein